MKCSEARKRPSSGVRVLRGLASSQREEAKALGLVRCKPMFRLLLCAFPIAAMHFLQCHDRDGIVGLIQPYEVLCFHVKYHQLLPSISIERISRSRSLFLSVSVEPAGQLNAIIANQTLAHPRLFSWLLKGTAVPLQRV